MSFTPLTELERRWERKSSRVEPYPNLYTFKYMLFRQTKANGQATHVRPAGAALTGDTTETGAGESVSVLFDHLAWAWWSGRIRQRTPGREKSCGLLSSMIRESLTLPWCGRERGCGLNLLACLWPANTRISHLSSILARWGAEVQILCLTRVYCFQQWFWASFLGALQKSNSFSGRSAFGSNLEKINP